VRATTLIDLPGRKRSVAEIEAHIVKGQTLSFGNRYGVDERSLYEPTTSIVSFSLVYLRCIFSQPRARDKTRFRIAIKGHNGAI